MSIQAKNFKIALVQLLVGSNKTQNLQHARQKVLEAAKQGAQVVVLPECFNSPYGTKYFPEYAESIPEGPSVKALSQMAKEGNIWLIGGSIPEKHDEKLYNTCTVYDPLGNLVARHRKIHLFDIDVPGKIRFMESDALSPGTQHTLVDTPYGRLGVGICYDIRFPELTMIAARRGAVAMIFPGAFNMVTGPLHWELLQRARAVDNQIYVAACSPARNPSPQEGDYVAWGHSTLVDPSGQVQATTEEGEAIVYSEVDVSKISDIRSSIPVSTQRRFDVYPDVSADGK